MHPHGMLWIGLIFWGLLGSSGIMATEAQIAFQIKKGWIAFTLEKDGLPVPDALVEILDENGTKFAEGTTGSKGQGQFPMPTGEQFKVEVKIGERSANTITLTRINDSVVPLEVLLSYGSKPCCKIGPFTFTEDQDAISRLESIGIPVWFQMLASASLIIGGTYFAYSLGRPSPKKQINARRKNNG